MIRWAAAASGYARAERAQADADACNGAEADNSLTSSLPRNNQSRRPRICRLKLSEQVVQTVSATQGRS